MKQTNSPHGFQRACWIWPQSHNWDLHNSYALFRKAFVLTKVPGRAPLFITADQSYQLYVNGRYVCRGPARGFQRSWPYDEVELRPFLRRGRNVLAVRAHNPGFSNFQYLTQGYAGLLVSAKWGNLIIASDKTWKCRRQDGINRAAVPTSLQLFCQEHIDLRDEDPGWMDPDFDDSGWTGLVAEAPWNGMPWSSLEPRGIPMLEEEIISPAGCLGVASGRCGKDYRTARDVARIRFHEGLAHSPSNSKAEELRVAPIGRGRFRSFLIYFGKTVVGSVGLEIRGAAGGETVDTLHVETIDEATLSPHFEPDKHCRMAFAHRLVCRSGNQTHVFYHAFGFRYMVLTVRDCTAEIRIRPFLRTTLYPMRKMGNFRSADPALQRIWETCAWTQRVCSLDAYVDTPWREQVQWWGDARVQAKNTFFYSGDTRLFRRGIRQIAMQTTPDGLTYGHAPTMAHNCILPDFTLIWMVTLGDYYWQTGSLEPFLSHQGTIHGALDYFRRMTDPKTGLVGYDKRYWLFLDWTELFKEGYSTVYNLWLLIALEKLAALFRISGDRQSGQVLTAQADSLRRSLRKLVREDGLLSDGMTFACKLVTSASIHSQTLAILAGFQPENDGVRLQKVLLPFIRQETAPEISPTSYWVTYVFEALTSAGYGRDVIEFIRNTWSPMAGHGSTWEGFEPSAGNTSHSHAWSAHPLYHLMEILGGIRQIAAGWKEVVFQPVFVGEEADIVVPTPLGKIHSTWKRNGRDIQVRLSLPPGISARVILPHVKPRKFSGRTKWRIPGDPESEPGQLDSR